MTALKSYEILIETQENLAKYARKLQQELLR